MAKPQPSPSGAPALHLHVVAPPPLVYAAGIALGLALDRFVPVATPPRLLAPGLGLVAAGAALALAAFASFRRARTTVLPWGQARVFVPTGPYRWTRNPMYVGMTLASAGILLAVGSVWGWLGLALALPVIHYGVIRREEAHFAARFGDEYREYQRRVRRWV
jgi:protein-S-isoprenylcysteine O-methyltransferase Ste14